MEGITQVWKITRLVVLPKLGTLTDVISGIEWALVTDASAIGGERYVSIGHSILNLPSIDNFITLETIGREQALTWIQDMLGVSKIKELEATATQYVLSTLLKDHTQTIIVKPESITDLSWLETID